MYKRIHSRKNFPLMIAAFALTGFLIIHNAKAQDNYLWKSVIVGGGGFIPGIIYHPNEPGLIYARTDMGGAYRWDNGGRRWVALTDSISRNMQSADFMGILSIALDPNDTNRVYMETGKYTQSWAGDGALLTSTDQGNTWSTIPLPFKVGGNEDGRGCGERLQVDPNADSILFMGTSSNSSTSPSQPALWKSTNYGASWSSVQSFGQSNVNFVLIDPTSGSHGTPSQRIFVSAANTSGPSLYETTDGGNSWAPVLGQPTGVMAIRGALADTLLYITLANYQGPNGATAGSVWKYNFSSGTWTNISPSSGSYGFSGISLYPKNPNYIVVSTLDCWYPMDEVYYSTDGGMHWTGKLRSAHLDHSYAPYTSTVNPHWLACVTMDPFDSSKAMFGTGFGIWACDNLFASTPTWYFKDANLEETVPMQIVSPQFTNLLSAMGDYDGFRHDSLDVSPPQGRWNPAKGTTLSITFASKVPSKLVKAYNQSPFGAYSTDGGTTWRDFSRYPSGTTAGGSWAVAISADGKTIVWSPAGTTTPWYSTDNGKTWMSSGGGAPSSPPVADPVNPAKFYVYNCLQGQLWVSNDSGKTFTKGAGGFLTVPSYQAQDGLMTAVPGYEGDLWICAGDGGLYHVTNPSTAKTKVNSVNSAYLFGVGKPLINGGYPALYLWGKVGGILGIFRSDDIGSSWTRINDDGHQFGYLHQVTGDMRVYGRCYISAEGRGILYGEPPNADTTDNPTTFKFYPGLTDSLRQLSQIISIKWSRAADPKGDSLTYILHFFCPGIDTTFKTPDSTEDFSVGNIQPSSQYVLTGYVTNGFDTTASANAIWFNTASTITTISHLETLPTEFTLYQNYPNPFNPSTSITYRLPSTSHVTLRIYDVLGREVSILVNEVKQPGKYVVRFDGTNFSSGVYFCTMKAGKFFQTEKLLLLK
jgi:photosystem II stability/assembly factor-like uncharacterized protein